METQLPSQKGGKARPEFSAHVHCSEMAAWIKMPLGTEVGLDPDPNSIVLHGEKLKLFITINYYLVLTIRCKILNTGTVLYK